MARTGRPKKQMPTNGVEIALPLDLKATVDLLLTDPVRKKPKLGAWSQLVEKLLRDWLKTQTLPTGAQVAEQIRVSAGVRPASLEDVDIGSPDS